MQANISGLIRHYNNQAVLHLSRKTQINYHVHQSRLCCKRIRSILRLARPALINDDYRFFNRFYRDASRRIAQARDLTALIETIDLLISGTSSSKLVIFLTREKHRLFIKRKNLLNSTDFKNQKQEISDLFVAAETKLENISIKDNEITLLGSGILNTYHKGVIFWELNLKNNDCHLMHEWRKQVKYFWYQLVVLEPLWPVIFEALAREFQALSKLLGQYQDLTLLEIYLKEQREKINFPNELAVGLRIITLRKKDLAKRSLHLGDKLFASQKCKGLSGWFKFLLNTIG